MKYINEKSNRGLVNLFSDYIVNLINKDKQYDVVIEITDCGKFFVINGMTNSDKILDMVTVKESFLETYKSLLTNFGYENVNVIDLIMYGKELAKKDDYTFDFYNSSRPIYHYKLKNIFLMVVLLVKELERYKN